MYKNIIYNPKYTIEISNENLMMYFSTILDNCVLETFGNLVKKTKQKTLQISIIL